MKNILEEIEGKYPVDTILVNGEQVWPYLRMAYYSGYRKSLAFEWGEEQLVPPLPKRFMKIVKNSFYGLRHWFHKYDYIVLSNTLERRNINGKYFNKLLDPIIDELGQDRVLYVEAPAPTPYPAKRVHTKNIVSNDLPTLPAAIWARFKTRGCVLQNGFILKTIQKEYGLKIDDARRIKFFGAERRLFDLLLRKVKPKALLLSAYYGYIPAIKAARDLGITVVEVQHGAIGKEHPAYNVNVAIDKSYFPDYLLVFGRKELETFDNPRFIEPENVYPVGSFYIDYVKNNYVPETGLIRKLENYNRTVGVTLQWTTEKHTIEFISQAASLDKTILYLLIPRKPQEEHYSTLNLPNNVRVIKDKNFYELMMYVDFHSTVYSTCALEAPSLGTQNIFINIDNLSRQYYGTILNDSQITRYVDTPEEFVNVVNDFEKLDRDTIVRLNDRIIATNYRSNIQNFISKYLT